MNGAEREQILAAYARRSAEFERVAARGSARGGLFAAIGHGSGAAPAAEEPQELTQAELTVLSLIAAGKTNEEIAHALLISCETVKTHVRHLLVKLAARNRAHAVFLAIGRRLIIPPSFSKETP